MAIGTAIPAPTTLFGMASVGVAGKGGFTCASAASLQLARSENVSQFWYGSILANITDVNPVIAGMVYSLNPSTAPFHCWTIFRSGNTDLKIGYNNGGTFGSLTASGALSSAEYGIPIALGATYGRSGVALYKNGRSVVAGSGISGIAYGSASRYSLGYTLGALNDAHVGTVVSFAFGCALTPTDHLMLARNPYQLFVPVHRQATAPPAIPDPTLGQSYERIVRGALRGVGRGAR